jgi:hypothetical protein
MLQHYQLQALFAIVVVDIEPVGDFDQDSPGIISALRISRLSKESQNIDNFHTADIDFMNLSIYNKTNVER